MTGANYVHISAYSEMPGLFATKAVRQTDDASIRYIIRKVKARGFKVFFKPVIEIKGEKWRGFVCLCVLQLFCLVVLGAVGISTLLTCCVSFAFCVIDDVSPNVAHGNSHLVQQCVQPLYR